MGAKMRYLIVAMIVVNGIASSCGYAKSTTDKNKLVLNVIYADFRVDPITGYHAKDLERVGCRFTISARVFETLLKSRVEKSDFNAWDLRGEVISNDGTKMYVDRDGILKNSSGFFRIDKERFVRALVPTKKCTVSPAKPG